MNDIPDLNDALFQLEAAFNSALDEDPAVLPIPVESYLAHFTEDAVQFLQDHAMDFVDAERAHDDLPSDTEIEPPLEDELWLNSSLASEDVTMLQLGQELISQNESRLREYSNMIANDPTLLRVYVDIVFTSRSVQDHPDRDRTVTTAAANAISVLNYGSRSGLFPFRFIDVRDWSSIRVPGANLNYAIMAHRNLNDADLSGSSIIHIVLHGAQLQRTNLAGVKLYERNVYQVRPQSDRSGEKLDSVLIHPNGYMAASNTSKGTIRIFNYESGQDLCYLYEHTSSSEPLSFSSDGKYLSSICRSNRAICIWDMTTYQCVSLFRAPHSEDGNGSNACHVAFSSDSTRIAMASGRDTISMGTIAASEWTTTLHHDQVRYVEWSPTSHRILALSSKAQCELLIWDVESCSTVVTCQTVAFKGSQSSSHLCTNIQHAQYTLDGHKIVATAALSIYIFDAATGDHLLTHPMPDMRDAECKRFTLDQLNVYLPGLLGQIWVLNLKTLDYVAKLPDVAGSCNHVLTADGQTLVMYCPHDTTIRTFDIPSLSLCVPTFPERDYTCSSLTFSPDNSHVIMGDKECSSDELLFLNLLTSHCTSKAEGSEHKSDIYLPGYEPYNRLRAFAVDFSSCIKTYNYRRYEHLPPFEHHNRYIDDDGGYDEHGTYYSSNNDHDYYSNYANRLFTVSCVAFNAKRDLLASNASNHSGWKTKYGKGAIVLWDTTTWTHRTLRGHVDEVRHMCFSPDDKALASASEDGTIRLWNVITDECLTIIPSELNACHRISYSPCGRFLASLSPDCLYIWSTTDGTCLSTYRQSTNPLTNIRFRKDGRILAQGQTFGVIDIFTNTRMDLGVRAGSLACMSLDASLMTACAAGGAGYVWQLHTHPVKCVVAHEDPNLIGSSLPMTVLGAVTTENGVVILSQFTYNGSIYMYNGTRHPEVLEMLEQHSNITTCMHLSSHHGVYLVSGSEDCLVRIWNLETRQCVGVLEGHTGAASCVQLSADHRVVVSGSYDKVIRLWNLPECKCVGEFIGHTTAVKHVVVSADNSILVSTELGSNSIYIWDVATGTNTIVLNQHTDQVFDIQLSADGRHLVSGSHDNTVRVWDVTTGECVRTMNGHPDWLTCFAFTSDTQTVIMGSKDKTIRIWDVATGECKLVIQGHTNLIRSLYVTPDDRCIISASNDRVIHIWDIATGAMLHQLTGHRGAVTSITLAQYNEDGDSTLVSTSIDGAVRIWTIHKMRHIKYVPELQTLIGEQTRMDLSGADLTQTIMGSPLVDLLGYRSTQGECFYDIHVENSIGYDSQEAYQTQAEEKQNHAKEDATEFLFAPCLPNLSRGLRICMEQLDDPAMAALAAICWIQGVGCSPNPEKAIEILMGYPDLPRAQALLAECYIFGKGVTPNLEQGASLLESAANAGDLYASLVSGDCYRQGKIYTDMSDLEKASREYEQVLTGDTSCLDTRFMECLANLRLSQVSYDQTALAHLREAAQFAYPLAWYELGRVLLDEAETDAYHAIAMGYVRRAADARYLPACLFMAQALSDTTNKFSTCLGIDLQEAAKYYLFAAEQGDLSFQTFANVWYSKLKCIPPKSDDLNQVMGTFASKAKQSDANVELNLGLCYYLGCGADQDHNQALVWFEKAAIRGKPLAEFWVGRCYYFAEGVAQNYKLAFDWYLLSAQKGNLDAQHSLGICYECGHGVEQDYHQAFEWYLKSANQGHAQAQCSVGHCYAKGQGVSMDLQQAFAWYLKSANNGNAEAQYCLAECYKNGRGIYSDSNEALGWYQTSASQGNLEALYALGIC